MDSGKVPAGETPNKTLRPLATTAFAISARENTAAGADGELHYNVFRKVNGKDTPWGAIRLTFSRDANSCTRSQSCTMSGRVNAGEYELTGSFPCNSHDCTFVLKKKKVEIKARGQLGSMLGGGDFEAIVPLEDAMHLPFKMMEGKGVYVATGAVVGGLVIAYAVTANVKPTVPPQPGNTKMVVNRRGRAVTVKSYKSDCRTYWWCCQSITLPPNTQRLISSNENLGQMFYVSADGDECVLVAPGGEPIYC